MWSDSPPANKRVFQISNSEITFGSLIANFISETVFLYLVLRKIKVSFIFLIQSFSQLLRDSKKKELGVFKN